MKNLLHNAWKTLFLRGIFAVFFGILTFIWPGLTLITLIYLFAFYSFADGFATLSGAWQNRKSGANWGLLFLSGIIGLLVGIITLFYPGLTAIYLIIFIGIRAILDGMLTMIAAIRLRKEINNEGMLALGGLISMLFGFWVILKPGQGALTFAWIVALFATVIGIILILLAFKAKEWVRAVSDKIEEKIN